MAAVKKVWINCFIYLFMCNSVYTILQDCNLIESYTTFVTAYNLQWKIYEPMKISGQQTELQHIKYNKYAN